MICLRISLRNACGTLAGNLCIVFENLSPTIGINISIDIDININIIIIIIIIISIVVVVVIDISS